MAEASTVAAESQQRPTIEKTVVAVEGTPTTISVTSVITATPGPVDPARQSQPMDTSSQPQQVQSSVQQQPTTGGSAPSGGSQEGAATDTASAQQEVQQESTAEEDPTLLVGFSVSVSSPPPNPSSSEEKSTELIPIRLPVQLHPWDPFGHSEGQFSLNAKKI